MTLGPSGRVVVAAPGSARPPARRPRARRVAMVLAPLLFYCLVWVPWQRHVEGLERVLPRAQRSLASMQREARRLPPRPADAVRAGTALLSDLAGEAQTAMIGTRLTELSPRGRYQAQAVLSAVPFNTLVRFLAAVRARGVVVSRVALTAAGAGCVSGTIIVRVSR